jgi:hypothetical protein
MQNILNNSAFTELAKEKKNIFSLLNKNLEQLSVNINTTEFIETIQKSLSNPDFPLPRLRR